MSGTEQCDRCGREVLWASQFNGARRPFNPDPVAADVVAAAATRWYAVRGKGMLPGDMLNEAQLEGRPYLTRHYCLATVGANESSVPEVRNLPGTVKTQDLQLGTEYEYTYRWPTSWAHVLHTDQYVALCNARLPQGRRTNPRERDRLRGMPVCPDCIDRLNLPPDSRARVLLHQIQEQLRQNSVEAVEEILPSQTGFVYFRARSKGITAIVHTADCPTLLVPRFVPADWTMTVAYPLGYSPCPTCSPITGLDDLHERRVTARKQAEVAAEVARAQAAQRYKVSAERFSALGTYVYRPAGGGKPITKVHHHTCRGLAHVDPAGWVGVHEVPSDMASHSCTTTVANPWHKG